MRTFLAHAAIGAVLFFAASSEAAEPGTFFAWPALPTGGPITGGLFAAPYGESYERAKQCLTEAVYYEAATEPAAGQHAVAQVVLNRVRHPVFPKSVCGVVFQGSTRATGCQFTFTCDGSLSRRPVAALWTRAESVAADALAGRLEDEVGNSTHYHASWMVPYWRSSMTETARIGGHVFYRMSSRQGSPPTLSPYAGVEPAPPASLAAAKARKAGRHASQTLTATVTAPPRPSSFSVWGLKVATVTPAGHDLQVDELR